MPLPRITDQYRPRWRIPKLTLDDLETVRPGRRSPSAESEASFRSRRRSLGDLSEDELMIPVDEYMSMRKAEEEKLMLEDELELGFSASPVGSPVHMERHAMEYEERRQEVRHEAVEVAETKKKRTISQYMRRRRSLSPTYIDRAIVSSLRIKVVTTQYKSSLEISSVTASDEGSYTVVVENAAGRQEAHFTLTIRKEVLKEEVKAVKSPDPSPAPSVKSPEPMPTKSPERVKSPEPEELKSPRGVKSPEPSGIKSPPGVKSPEPSGIKSPPGVKSPEPSGIKSPPGVKSPEPSGIKSPPGVKSPEPSGIKSPPGVKSPEPSGIKSPPGVKSPEPAGIKSPPGVKSPEPAGIKSPPGVKSPEPAGIKTPKGIKSPEPLGIKSPRALKSPEPEGLKSPPRVKSPPPIMSPKRVASPPTVKSPVPKPPKVMSQLTAEAYEGSVRMSPPPSLPLPSRRCFPP
uniref:Immunoglobulin I-set domain-containing protein n=1 Tax=Salarias fasciatus TaxID=181472 RepID=A0A672I953_SALFA